ncbi:hypothetical protein E2C01_041957 [Portunus trituberculatus]|uniref:Uncharacterized protein n=1 Tax=Portunus trituberculatus TaxID=210409 RepID=A0A5B7FSE1_PORTR|nr:hypothetical protein [Portunus trituberculatus]
MKRRPLPWHIKSVSVPLEQGLEFSWNSLLSDFYTFDSTNNNSVISQFPQFHTNIRLGETPQDTLPLPHPDSKTFSHSQQKRSTLMAPLHYLVLSLGASLLTWISASLPPYFRSLSLLVDGFRRVKSRASYFLRFFSHISFAMLSFHSNFNFPPLSRTTVFMIFLQIRHSLPMTYPNHRYSQEEEEKQAHEEKKKEEEEMMK